MAEKIGRLGYLGLAIEGTSGSAESTPDIFIPFTENSLRGHQEPLMDVASHTTRIKDYGSVSGRKWGEGSVAMYLDSSTAGYLLKMAFGTEVRTQLSATPPTHNHLLTRLYQVTLLHPLLCGITKVLIAKDTLTCR